MIISPLSILSPLGSSRATSWTPLTNPVTAAKILFWGKESELGFYGSLNFEPFMPNKMNPNWNAQTDYLIQAGANSPYEYQLPDTTPYINADTGNWLSDRLVL